MWVLKTKSGKKIYFEKIKNLQLVLTAMRKFGDDGFIYKIKTSPIQNTIIAASIMGNLLSFYDHRVKFERTKSVELLRSRVRKFLAIKSRTNKNEYLKALSYSNFAWQKMIDVFVKNKTPIELATAVMRVYGLYSEQLNKYANINEKQMDAFALGMIGEITLEIEQSSYVVVDFLLDELSKFTGVKRKKLRPVAQNYEKKAA
ncbi:hypothetical protein [Sulfurimonas sp.]|uniref:hypothetical protein n=1 Tax=Sulfurimonas sp. TaxID=2022749 RepID=UPI002639390D|nr:hypothetical protein [Sulfurimonas sp.]MDD3450951.1 hypothetical protein [Sulfurimonas sp.]